ncbi:ricin-type beta-trefoil lectin domain protein [Nonomuraea sp. NPDC050643]|uniref:ricin-type beta-trefoil lectin domain protein n=1 Tax=Nonomuraea sp. NPDC050643 TaxID=3155660 RepID=UPI0033FC8F4C
MSSSWTPVRRVRGVAAAIVLTLLAVLLPQPGASGESALGSLALSAPQRLTLKILHFNMAGAAKNDGRYPIIGRIIREVQERRPDVISLNEVCDRQYAHLLIQLDEIGYPMQGYFQESRTIVPDCIVPPDTRNEAGNAVLVRGEVRSTKGYMFTTDHRLEERDQPTVTEQRSVACLSAWFGIPDELVKVCSTHLTPKEDGAANPYAGPEAEARELARVFGPEAAVAPFILMGDLNLLPGNPALNTLYAPAAGTTGRFWETDMHHYCTEVVCEGPVQGGAPSHAQGKIDYTFVSRAHFSFEYDNVQMIDAGNCDDHVCSDHRMFRSEVVWHQTATPYGLVRNQSSGKCVIVRGTADNAAAVQYTCLPQYADQLWRFEHAGWGWYRLRNQNSQKCLIARGSTAGGPAVQYTCSSQYNDQFWQVGDPQAGMLRLVSSGMCLLVRGAANDAPVVHYTCLPQYADQRWTYA